jgi:hypothetical protein
MDPEQLHTVTRVTVKEEIAAETMIVDTRPGVALKLQLTDVMAIVA